MAVDALAAELGDECAAEIAERVQGPTELALVLLYMHQHNGRYW